MSSLVYEKWVMFLGSLPLQNTVSAFSGLTSTGGLVVTGPMAVIVMAPT